MSIKIEGLDELKRQLDPKLYESVFKTTVNEIVSGSLSKARTKIKKKWNIDIKKDGKSWKFANKNTGEMKKTSGKIDLIRANRNNDSLYIYVSGKPLNLSLFQYQIIDEVLATQSRSKRKRILKGAKKLTQRKKQLVRVKVLKNKTTTLETAFSRKMKSGHKGIFQRVGKSSLPILEKKTITPQSMFRQVGFNSILEQDLHEKLIKRFEHHLERKQKGKY